MKIVRAYEALDGSLHKRKEDAALTSLLHMGEETRKDIDSSLYLGLETAEFLIENRQSVIAILHDIDVPDDDERGSE